jgi:hypothetical protein
MGYTHYWNFEPNKVKDTETLRKKFNKASKQIKSFANWLPNKGIKICGGLGQGKPIFNETEIWFNGDASEHLDHETFNIHWCLRVTYKDSWRDFCKTACKPYDLLVCFALLTFAEIFPEAFSFSSDGDMEDSEWQQGVEYYETFTGKTAKIPQDMLKQEA